MRGRCKGSRHKPPEDYYKPPSYSQSHSRYPNLKFTKDEIPARSAAVIRFTVFIHRAVQGDEHVKNRTTGLSRFHAIPDAKLFRKSYLPGHFASWCQPCRAELKHYPALQDFFTDNDVVCLFASVDSDKADCDQCVELLNESGLQGYFVTYLAQEGSITGQFANELGALFCDTDQEGKIVRISVPRYITFDRQGKIVERHAQRPSNGEELKKELSEYLR